MIFAFDSSKPLEPSVILSFGASKPPYGTSNFGHGAMYKTTDTFMPSLIESPACPNFRPYAVLYVGSTVQTC